MEESSNDKIILSYLSQSIEISLPQKYEELLRIFIKEFKIDKQNQKKLDLKYKDEENDDIELDSEMDFTEFKKLSKRKKINKIEGYISQESQESCRSSLNLLDNNENEFSERADMTFKEEKEEKTLKENLELIKKENENYKIEIEKCNSKIKNLEEEKNKIIAENEKNI